MENEYTVEELQKLKDILSDVQKDTSLLRLEQFTSSLLTFFKKYPLKCSLIKNEFHNLPQVLHSHYINLTEEIFHDIKVRELFGEHKYFVIFQENSSLSFEIHKRHLNKLLFLSNVDDIIRMMHIPVVNSFVKWRLLIGK